jgi:hypothetical protein
MKGPPVPEGLMNEGMEMKNDAGEVVLVLEDQSDSAGRPLCLRGVDIRKVMLDGANLSGLI